MRNRMSRQTHEAGDCNGDWTCIWCWYENAEDDEREDEDE